MDKRFLKEKGLLEGVKRFNYLMEYVTAGGNLEEVDGNGDGLDDATGMADPAAAGGAMPAGDPGMGMGADPMAGGAAPMPGADPMAAGGAAPMPGADPNAAQGVPGFAPQDGAPADTNVAQESFDEAIPDDQQGNQQQEGGEDEEDEGATEGPKEFTVSASGNILYKADSMGNPDGDAVSSLTFTGSGNVVVKSEDPFKSWTVNGVRFEPEEEISSFKMLNLSSDTSISLKVAAKTAASAKVDESNMLTVTCKGCTFTYLRGGLKKVASGKVPSGAVIYVFADSYDAAANGYVVNGGEAQSQGAASMQVTVTEDTEIVVK